MARLARADRLLVDLVLKLMMMLQPAAVAGPKQMVELAGALRDQPAGFPLHALRVRPAGLPLPALSELELRQSSGTGHLLYLRKLPNSTHQMVTDVVE